MFFKKLNSFDNTKADYETIAENWAAKHGVVDYKVKGGQLLFKQSFEGDALTDPYSILYTVNLDNFSSDRERVRYDKRGLENMNFH